MAEYDGWLLDLYEDPQHGVSLWIIDQDGSRLHLHQDFPVAFYAAGPTPRLHALCQFLKTQPLETKLERVERRDLFSPQPLVLLEVQAPGPSEQARLFRQAARLFPDLVYYDADIPLALRYAAVHDAFPLARCRVSAGPSGQVQEIHFLDSRWELDPEPPPLQIMFMQPNCDPSHDPPTSLTIRAGRFSYRLALEHERPLLVNLCAILKRHDPDLLLTDWGDTWLLPYLIKLSRRRGLPLPLNRDSERGPARRPERTYFSYGQVIHRGPQILLFGRCHIDRLNAVLYGDYALEGVQELSRVTALPLQTAARVSPGTGISSMQIITALRQQVLVPWRKQQAERPKTALELLRSDQGGLVYQPLVGLHRDVAAVDFISMYPSIMAHFNISPETVGTDNPGAPLIPQLNLRIDQEKTGLVPQTLQPLLQKRLRFKERLADLPAWAPRRRTYTARSSAHKWLLVTCFGYLGYKNARFGRIEAHEAVTAYGREALMLAKEAAEDLDGTVLHLYVDGLWIRQPGAATPGDFQPLLEDIAERTGLPIALDGIYRWVAFLPSRQDARLPVANRYFGVFQDGSLKIRGIEARREDTPAFIAETQMEILHRLAAAPDADCLPERLPEIRALLRKKLRALRTGRAPLESLLVSQKLSRNLDAYHVPSPAARAAAQLEAAGKPVRRGQRVRFLYTLGDPGVFAWNRPDKPDPETVDKARYKTLLLRAASTVLQPLGVDEAALQQWLLGNVVRSIFSS
jgi:DNA polymerase II